MMDDPQPLEMAVQAVSEDTLYHVAKLFHAFKQLRVDGIHMNGIISEYIDESLLNRAFDIHLQGVIPQINLTFYFNILKLLHLQTFCFNILKLLYFFLYNVTIARF